MSISDLALAVAPYVIRDNSVPSCKRFRLASREGPHLMAEGKAMNQDHRHAGRDADVDVVTEGVID